MQFNNIYGGVTLPTNRVLSNSSRRSYLFHPGVSAIPLFSPFNSMIKQKPQPQSRKCEPVSSHRASTFRSLDRQLNEAFRTFSANPNYYLSLRKINAAKESAIPAEHFYEEK